eukprot:gene16047-22183_t
MATATAPSDPPKRGIWDGSKMFLAGGGAGAVARTCTAPLDRIKLLFQVQAVASSGTSSTAYTGVGQAAAKIFREEGFLAFWKGNGVNIIRIFPYSASQLAANDFYKAHLADANHELTLAKRLTAGACAGMTATAITHPLDTVRLRLALPNHPYKGSIDAISTMVRTEGIMSLYKGLVPTLVGVAPYAALNFATYDLTKKWLYHGERPQSTVSNLLLGAFAGTTAATICYPLDTVRRRMQMKGKMYKNQLDALQTIAKVSVVPQNAIRFVTYETLKSLFGIQKAKTDT